MRNNIFIPIILLLSGLLCAGVSKAQSPQPYQGSISVKPVRVERVDRMLYVDMDVVLENVKLRTQQGINLMPYIASSDRKLYLPEIELKGKDEDLSYERKMTLMSRRERDTMQLPYAVERVVGKRNNKTLQYRYQMPYEPWMADAQVGVEYDLCGCGNAPYTIRTDYIARIAPIVPYQIVPTLVYVVPETEAIKRREAHVEAYLDFVVNRTDIRPDYMNNPSELAKIHRVIDRLNGDPDVEVTSCRIIGYASPEGSVEGNRRLSEGRARALRDYLPLFNKFSRERMQVEFGGENWEGLVLALEDSDLEYKQYALDIIRNYTVEQGRKERLKNLQGGAPYRDMLTNIYPQLRVAVCSVEYRIENYDLQRAKEVLESRPENLSPAELYMVAESYSEDSPEFRKLIDTSVKIYPGNDAANLNAATSAVLRRDFTSAEQYLNRVDPGAYPAEYYNTLGMMYALQDRYDLAEEYFTQAVRYRSREASSNLEELDKRRKTIENQ